MTEIGLGEHHAREEGPEGERNPEQFRRAEGDPQRHRQDGEGEKLPRAGTRRLIEQPGYEAASANQHQAREDRDFGEGQKDGEQQAAGIVRADEVPDEVGERVDCAVRGPSRLAPEGGGKGWQDDEREHHRQIFDDEPAHGDAPIVGVEQTALLQGSQQDHGARDG
jgi:hypothetical protein